MSTIIIIIIIIIIIALYIYIYIRVISCLTIRTNLAKFVPASHCWQTKSSQPSHQTDIIDYNDGEDITIIVEDIPDWTTLSLKDRPAICSVCYSRDVVQYSRWRQHNLDLKLIL